MSKSITPSTRNITRLFRTATPEEIQSGADWYTDAFRIAGVFADRYNVTREIAAGVIAALSPLNSWKANVALADRFLAGARDSGYLSVGLAKARSILAGEDILSVLKSDKVSNFYRSIITRGAEGVTVDRHSFDVAVNVRHNDDTRPKIGKRLYAETAEAYVRAARILSKEYGMRLTPGQVQSVTWVLHRAKYWASGAWDVKTA